MKYTRKVKLSSVYGVMLKKDPKREDIVTRLNIAIMNRDAEMISEIKKELEDYDEKN